MQGSAGTRAVIRGSGVYVPEHVITNAELAESYNAFAAGDGAQGAGTRVDDAYIFKSSGIRSRRVVDKEGILEAGRMRPRLRRRAPSEMSLQAEIALHAARRALDAAGADPAQLGLVIVAATALERAYPAIAIELQQLLGAGQAFAFDMNAACSSATFAIAMAADAIAAGTVRSALVVSPELATAQVDFRDRQSHFIFGDGAAAVVLQAQEPAQDADGRGAGFRILGHAQRTEFSNAIRNDFGFLEPCFDARDGQAAPAGGTFRQNGVRVMRDVVPMASRHILAQLEALSIAPADVARVWLHQANAHINRLICQKVFGHAVDDARAPSILAERGNLAAAGALAAFSEFHDDLPPGAVGVICSFGAGYSVGSIVVQRT